MTTHKAIIEQLVKLTELGELLQKEQDPLLVKRGILLVRLVPGVNLEDWNSIAEQHKTNTFLDDWVALPIENGHIASTFRNKTRCFDANQSVMVHADEKRFLFSGSF